MKRILEVQKEIGSLAKQSKNPFFKSAYLDLNDLLTHVTPLLNSKGLVLLQPVIGNTVTTQIIDSKDGVVLAESSINIPDNLTDPQKIGSCLTYFRRYTLKSLLSIAEGDDDGNLASKPEPTPTEKQILDAIGKATSQKDLTAIKQWVKHFDLTDIAITKSKTFK